MLGLTTGYRISELLSLTIGDLVDQSGDVAQTLLISRARMKGKRQSRDVVLSNATRDVIRKWLDVLSSNGFRARDDYVFCMLNGHPINYREYWAVLKRAAGIAGVSPLRGIGTHSMRKTFAWNVWKSAKQRELSGANIDAWRVVQDALGHADIKSTGHYMDFLSREDINPSIIAAQESVLCLVELDFGR